MHVARVALSYTILSVIIQSSFVLLFGLWILLFRSGNSASSLHISCEIAKLKFGIVMLCKLPSRERVIVE